MYPQKRLDAGLRHIPPLTMGLEDFTTEGNEVEDDTTPTGGSRSGAAPDVGPRFAYQGFAPDSEVTARSIKYQIKSFSVNWKTQFSMLRFNTGELVLYSAGVNVSEHGETVMVFTTIQSIMADEPPENDLDIWVVPWDLNKGDNLSEGTYISFTSEWNERLHNAVGKHLEELGTFD